MAPSAPTRWRPTPEQVMILEELYRSGVKTPNAPQIQRITSHLSLYGKIQGKSVFYWFQNHKAREKKKLRKKLVLKHLQLQQQKQQEDYGKCALVADHHPLEVIMEQEQSNHNLLAISHASPLNFHQLSHHDYSTSFTWGGSQVMDLSWKMETPQRISEEYSNVEMRSKSDHDRLLTKIMEDVGSLYTYCSTNTSRTRTLKTLELFPLTPANLKENCNPSSSNDLSSFNSIN